MVVTTTAAAAVDEDDSVCDSIVMSSAGLNVSHLLHSPGGARAQERRATPQPVQEVGRCRSAAQAMDRAAGEFCNLLGHQALPVRSFGPFASVTTAVVVVVLVIVVVVTIAVAVDQLFLSCVLTL